MMNDDDARGAGHGARKARDPRAVDDHVREKDARDEKWIDDADETRDAQRGDGEETRDIRGVVRGGARARGRARWGRHARVRVGTVGQLFGPRDDGRGRAGMRTVGRITTRARVRRISRYFLETVLGGALGVAYARRSGRGGGGRMRLRFSGGRRPRHLVRADGGGATGL